MPANDYVRARIDPVIKNEAAAVLAKMGLTVSDLCRMALTRVAHENACRLVWKSPMRKPERHLRLLLSVKGCITPKMRMTCSNSWAYKCFSLYSRPLFKKTLNVLKNAVTTWKN